MFEDAFIQWKALLEDLSKAFGRNVSRRRVRGWQKRAANDNPFPLETKRLGRQGVFFRADIERWIKAEFRLPRVA